MMSFGTLSIIYPDRQQQTWALTTATLRIGRADDNDLVLNDQSVSRYHAQLSCDASGCQITDLGSANGTLLAGVRLTPHAPQPLADGAQIQIGNVSLHFRSMAPYVAPTALSAVPAHVQPNAAMPPHLQGNAAVTPPLGVSAGQGSVPQVRATLNPTQVVLEAGGAAVVTLQIINTGTVVDHYSVQVDGWNQAWLATAPARLPLLPDAEGVITLTFRPPRTSEAYAQGGSVTVNVWSEHHRATVFSTQLPLTILPFSDFALQAEPARAITRGRADYQLTIHNRGNSAQTFALSARDDAGRVQCLLDQPAITVGPGQAGQTKLRAYAGKRAWSGPPQMYTIQIAAAPVDARGQTPAQGVSPLPLQGGAQVQLVQNARLPAWAIPMTLVVMMLMCGGGAWAADQYFRVGRAQAANQATATAVQATQNAKSDALVATQLAIQDRIATASEAEQALLATQLAQNIQQQTAQAQQFAATQTAFAATLTAQAATAEAAQAAATQTALAQSTATTPTPTVSVTPSTTADGPRGPNGFVLVPPVIDGVLNGEEWSNLSVGRLQAGSVSFANDRERLYLLLDVQADTEDDAFVPGNADFDTFVVAFDVDANRAIDVIYTLDPARGALAISRDGSGRTTAPSEGQVGPIFDRSSAGPTPHRMWEIALPLSELGVELGNPVSILVRISSPNPAIREEGSFRFTLAQPQ